MPQLQLIQRKPTFGEELGTALGGGLGQGLAQSLQGWLGKRENIRKSAGLAPIFEDFGLPKEDIQKMINSGLSPQELIPLAGIVQKQRAVEQKAQAQQKSDKENLQSTFDRLSELSRSENIGIRTTPSQFLGEKAREEQSEFTSLQGGLISAMRDLVNKGALTNQKFNFIINTLLPKHNDRQAVIRGKLKGIAQELGLNPSSVGQVSEKKEKEADFVLMQDPQGNIRQVPRNMAIQAQKAGGKLVK